MSLRQQVDIVFNDRVTSEEDRFSKGVNVMWGYRRFINPKTGQEDYKRILLEYCGVNKTPGYAEGHRHKINRRRVLIRNGGNTGLPFSN